jgi:hypothetical protein
MPVKGNAALRYILISSWAKEHKRAIEVARKTTRIHYMELCPLWLSYPSIENFLDRTDVKSLFHPVPDPKSVGGSLHVPVVEVEGHILIFELQKAFLEDLGKSHRLKKVK